MTLAKRMALLAAAAAIVAALPWVYAQVPQRVPNAVPPPAPGSQDTSLQRKPGPVNPAAPLQAGASVTLPARHDPARMSTLQRNLYLSAQRAADWLQRRNMTDGRFVYGFSPSLNQPLEEDSYLAQIEATFALARSARFFGGEGGFLARQILLRLLLSTTTDPQEKNVRFCAAPSNFVNRPAAAGLLILAISELPQPPEIPQDLLQAADELANYLQRNLREDGSVALMDSPEDVASFSGPALLGIARSQKLRPAAWKLDALRRACVYYQAYWRQHRSAALIPEHSAAFSEAFLLTRDMKFAEFVFEMNDWLVGHQYKNMDPARQSWSGGFAQFGQGKALPLAPDIRSAAAAQALAEACRCAQVTDQGRFGRYKQSLESCLVFLTSLQYTEAATQHFAEWYRPMLVGGFHASRRDGDLRIDYTQRALAAFVQYLEHVSEVN